MTYDFKPEPEFAAELGARIKFAWAGRTFEIVLSMEDE